MPASLIARDIAVTIGRQTILDGVSVTVAPGHRYGLIGPNGVGKSTLLRVLAGLVRPERGTVRRQPAAASVGLLDQEPERRAGETVRGFIARRSGVAAATTELDDATLALAGGIEGGGTADRYDAALHAWLGVGGADHETRVVGSLARLGLTESILDQEMTTLSGGEAAKARAGVAARGGTGRAPARRAHQRSRSRRARAARVVGARPAAGDRGGQPRPRLPRPHGDRRDRARRAHPPGPRLRRRLARLPGRAGHGAPPRGGDVRRVRGPRRMP